MIHLTLLTPSGTVIDEDVDSFLVPTPKGKLQINGGYTPIFEMLSEAGPLKIVKAGKPYYYAIFDGYVRIEPMKALLCCELCEDGYDIDTARANAALARAKARIDKKDENIDLARATAAMKRALARLEVKSLSEGIK